MKPLTATITLVLILTIWENAIFAQNLTDKKSGAPLSAPYASNANPKKWNPASDPHPSVARILAFEKGAHSFGSGTLIGETGQYGLVITNWHVVRETVGLVQVHFPNGFASFASVVSYDKTWDLALLLTSKPTNIPIVAISKETPKIDDPLWIAGYGNGKYRLIGGRCTKYIAPEIGFPNELIEVSVSARQGDSGGPIFNRKGEISGVLFGSDLQNTAGSCCERIRIFAKQSREKIAASPKEPETLFASIEPGRPSHSLLEGTQLTRTQLATEEETGIVVASSRSTSGSSFGGRGSAASRTAVKSIPAQEQAQSQIGFFPAFPPFERQTVVPASNNTVSAPLARTNNASSTNLPGLGERQTPTFSSGAGSVASSGTVQPSRVAINSSVREIIPSTPVRGQQNRNDSFENQNRQTARTNAEPLSSAYVETVPAARKSDPEEKYATRFPTLGGTVVETSLSEPNLGGPQQTQRSFFDVIKIVAAVVVVFFVIFHLIKLMSIIEENGQRDG